MGEFKYPLRFKGLITGVVVEFTGLNKGTIIEQGSHSGDVGSVITNWDRHTNTNTWTPVEMPHNTTRRKLHEAVSLLKKNS